MRICGFDVGIKTLSYTIFETDSQLAFPKLIDFKVINLLDPNDDCLSHICTQCKSQCISGKDRCKRHLDKVFCEFIITRGPRKGEKCNKLGCKLHGAEGLVPFTVPAGGLDRGLDSFVEILEEVNPLVGKPLVSPSANPSANLPANPSAKLAGTWRVGGAFPPCKYIFTVGKNRGKNCSKKIKEGLKFCSEKHKNAVATAKYKRGLNRLKRGGRVLNNQKIAELLVKRLDEIPEITQSDRILIELQPKFNTKMRNLSQWLFMYLVMRVKKLAVVSFVSAKNKLKVARIIGVKFINNRFKGKSARAYKVRKNNAEILCRKILEDSDVDPKFLKYFSNLRKQDDLSDSYLMTLWWCLIYKPGGKIAK